jgi:hypothetical protein
VNQYLQRMALSAIKPGGTIHPIVDSVYSTQRDHSYLPWLDENESVANPPVEQGSMNTEKQAAIAVPLPAAGFTDTSPLPEPIMGKIEPAVTEQPRAQRSRPSFLSPVEAETIATAENTQALVASSKSKAEAAGEGTRSGEVQRTEFLRPEIGVVRVSSQPRKVVSASRNPGGFEPKAGWRPRSGPPVHEPDEIQIHIGRIEVTAVHPAPAPAVVKPQRNVPSLDEYLKRRDRRAP